MTVYTLSSPYILYHRDSLRPSNNPSIKTQNQVNLRKPHQKSLLLNDFSPDALMEKAEKLFFQA